MLNWAKGIFRYFLLVPATSFFHYFSDISFTYYLKTLRLFVLDSMSIRLQNFFEFYRSKTSILRDPVDPNLASSFHTAFSDTVSFVYMFTSAIRIVIYYVCNPAVREDLQQMLHRSSKTNRSVDNLWLIHFVNILYYFFETSLTAIWICICTVSLSLFSRFYSNISQNLFFICHSFWFIQFVIIVIHGWLTWNHFL